MGWNDQVPFDSLLGKIINEIKGGVVGSDELVFTCDDGSKFRMYHSQDCCESVDIEDIDGYLDDLIGSPVTLAEESTSHDNPPGVPTSEYQDSFTWTFYRIATAKGFVVIRWYGSSNGYYSESVSFEKIQ